MFEFDQLRESYQKQLTGPIKFKFYEKKILTDSKIEIKGRKSKTTFKQNPCGMLTLKKDIATSAGSLSSKEF